LAVAYGQVISTLYSLLHEAGLMPEEIASSSVTLKMKSLTPEGSPSGEVGRLGRLSYGLEIAAAEAFDMGAKQHNGELTFEIYGGLEDCEDSSDLILAAIRDLRVEKEREGHMIDGALGLRVTTEKVGSGLGALLLCYRRLAPVFERAPGGASLTLHAVPATS